MFFILYELLCKIVSFIFITEQLILYGKYEVSSHIDELVETERVNSA